MRDRTLKQSRNPHRTQWAAQFAVASELCKRGYEVALTMGNNTPLAQTSRGGEREPLSQHDQKLKDELLDDLWRGRAKALGREDKIEEQIERGIATLETVCRSVLEKPAP